jgi:hypothetical protein
VIGIDLVKACVEQPVALPGRHRRETIVLGLARFKAVFIRSR